MEKHLGRILVGEGRSEQGVLLILQWRSVCPSLLALGQGWKSHQCNATTPVVPVVVSIKCTPEECQKSCHPPDPLGRISWQSLPTRGCPGTSCAGAAHLHGQLHALLRLLCAACFPQLPRDLALRMPHQLLVGQSKGTACSPHLWHPPHVLAEGLGRLPAGATGMELRSCLSLRHAASPLWTQLPEA